MNGIMFTSKVSQVGGTKLIIIPREESAKLPSRGQVMVRGKINNVSFESPLEPDGKGSHWLKVDDNLQTMLGVQPDDDVYMEMESSKEWPEPELPTDLRKALEKNADIKPLWDDITPMARWDWLRWINSTKSDITRAHRIDVAFSKLRHGSRRPCCFNRTMCTDPYVSKSGVLLEPATA